MKKAYSTPKVDTFVFEAKDIITASRVLNVKSKNEVGDIREIQWSDFTNGN